MAYDRLAIILVTCGLAFCGFNGVTTPKQTSDCFVTVACSHPGPPQPAKGRCISDMTKMYRNERKCYMKAIKEIGKSGCDCLKNVDGWSFIYALAYRPQPDEDRAMSSCLNAALSSGSDRCQKTECHRLLVKWRYNRVPSGERTCPPSEREEKRALIQCLDEYEAGILDLTDCPELSLYVEYERKLANALCTECPVSTIRHACSREISAEESVPRYCRPYQSILKLHKCVLDKMALYNNCTDKDRQIYVANMPFTVDSNRVYCDAGVTFERLVSEYVCPAPGPSSTLTG